jgi:hypothetical protein
MALCLAFLTLILDPFYSFVDSVYSPLYSGGEARRNQPASED